MPRKLLARSAFARIFLVPAALFTVSGGTPHDLALSIEDGVSFNRTVHDAEEVWVVQVKKIRVYFFVQIHTQFPNKYRLFAYACVSAISSAIARSGFAVASPLSGRHLLIRSSAFEPATLTWARNLGEI